MKRLLFGKFRVRTNSLGILSSGRKGQHHILKRVELSSVVNVAICSLTHERMYLKVSVQFNDIMHRNLNVKSRQVTLKVTLI